MNKNFYEYKPHPTRDDIFYVRITDNDANIEYKWALYSGGYAYQIANNKVGITYEEVKEAFALSEDKNENEYKLLKALTFMNINHITIPFISKTLIIPIKEVRKILKKYHIIISNKILLSEKIINEIIRKKMHCSYTHKELAKEFKLSLGTITRIINSSQVSETSVTRVKILASKNQMSASNIARELNLTTAAVKRILDNIERNGVLKNYNA